MKVYLTVGVSASGKSTWARTVARAMDAVIVCRDDIRLSQGLPHGTDEQRVTEIHQSQIEAALAMGKNVIVADTNLVPKFRNKLINFCHRLGADVELVPFAVSKDEAIIRDSKRGEASVGPDVINKQFSLWQPHTLTQTEFPVQSFEPYVREKVYDGSKPRAVVVDIDGTVAEMDGRNPYEYHKVSTDKPRRDVIEVVEALQAGGLYVVFASGREDTCFNDTYNWLIDNSRLRPFALFMREAKDMRPDWIVKNEMWDKKILPFYDVVAALDDRNQVVTHLRRRGVTVMQVAPGNF